MMAREQSVSGAAEYLHLSQPLSGQLKDLEDELRGVFYCGVMVPQYWKTASDVVK